MDADLVSAAALLIRFSGNGLVHTQGSVERRSQGVTSETTAHLLDDAGADAATYQAAALIKSLAGEINAVHAWEF